jgi:hypothetical protein
MTRTTTASTTSLGRGVLVGAGAGILASLVMALYAMIAGWAKGAGFFTPLYHIASLWASPNTMMASMEDGMAGNPFHFEFGPAVLGLAIHMMTAATYGAVFGLIVARLRLGTAALTGAGLVWGAAVFALSAFIGLPLAAALFGSGDPIANMAQMAGWGTFIIEHLLYGLVLGLLVALDRRRSSAVKTETAASSAH